MTSIIIKNKNVIVGINASYQDLIKKTIVQLTKNGEYIAEYESIYQAEQLTKIRHIYECVNHKRKTAGGYIWREMEEYLNG